MPLLDVQTASVLMNRPDIWELPSAYVEGAIAAVESDVVAYLGWNPALTVYSGEAGLAHLVAGGPFVGRYFIELKNQPLVPGDASDIFTSLRLSYPSAYPATTEVALTSVRVIHNTAQVFCLSPGLPEALVGAIGWGYAPLMSTTGAVSYTASYSAGFSCGESDPLDPITTDAFVGVAPLPAGIRDAALLLLRERLAYDLALNADPGNPQAVQRYRVRVGEREESYRSPYKAQEPSRLGFGGGLAEAAEAKLKKYVRRSTPLFV